MKPLLTAALLVTTLSAAHAAPAPPRLTDFLSRRHTWPPPDFIEKNALTLQVDKPTIPGGQPITVHILVKNTTPQTLWAQEAVTDRDYEFLVDKVTKTPDGAPTFTPAKLTEWGTQRFSGIWIFHRFYYKELKPGDTEQDSTLINHYFDMSLPGTYSIRVNCHAFVLSDKDRKTIKLESPPLQIEVR